MSEVSQMTTVMVIFVQETFAQVTFVLPFVTLISQLIPYLFGEFDEFMDSKDFKDNKGFKTSRTLLIQTHQTKIH